MSNKEAISVLIPTFNSARFIAEAIESVLAQSVKPFEIIIVDDGSTDETESIVRKFDGNIRYVYQENAGSSAARNKGLELIQGDYVSFLDADDIWVENKLEMQLNLLRKNPDYEIIIGLLIRIPISKTKEALNKEIGNAEHAVSLGSTLMKKQVFEKIGNFDEEMKLGQDLDLFFRALEAEIKVWGHEDVVQFYRRHDQNSTGNKKETTYYRLKAFKKSLDRRRNTAKKYTNVPSTFDGLAAFREFWQSKK